MIAVVQRVRSASVSVNGNIVGRIEKGLLVYVGVACGDSPTTTDKLADKIANLRIFPDDEGKLNRSVMEIGGQVLAISNFTLLADAAKGRRPSFAAAAPAAQAEPIHRRFVESLRATGCPVETGVFGADMLIASDADGPVNIIINMPGEANSGETQNI